MTKRLSLARETLAPLDAGDLVHVAGGQDDRISFPVLGGGCLDSLRLACIVDTKQPTRCLCP